MGFPFSLSPLSSPMQPETPVEDPLVWTIKGYLPSSALEIKCRWVDNENELRCEPHYFLKETGEFVKNDCFVALKKPLIAFVEQGKLQ